MSSVDGEVPAALVWRWAAGAAAGIAGLAVGTVLLEIVVLHPATFR